MVYHGRIYEIVRVNCILIYHFHDLYLFSIDFPESKKPSRTYQLVIERLQALNKSKYNRHGSFMQRVAGVKRGAPSDLDQSVRTPLPAVPKPFKLRVVSNYLIISGLYRFLFMFFDHRRLNR